MSNALQQRRVLEERASTLQQTLIAENDRTERKRLMLQLDEVIGERLAHEMEHGEKFQTYDRQEREK